MNKILLDDDVDAIELRIFGVFSVFGLTVVLDLRGIVNLSSTRSVSPRVCKLHRNKFMRVSLLQT